MSAMILFIAVLADIGTLVPLVGTVVGPLFFAVFSFYLWKKGYGFVNPRRLITQAIAVLAEIIPAIQMFPAIVTGAAIVLVLLRLQEKTGISATTLSSGKPPIIQEGVRQPVRTTPPPRYSDGMRAPNGGLKPSNIVEVDFGGGESEDKQKAA